MTELRFWAGQIEARSEDGEKGPNVVGGFAARYGETSVNMGGFVEQVDPSAFDGFFAENRNVLSCFNHDVHQLLGTTDAGTLSVESRDEGLHYSVVVPDTSYGHDLVTLVERGDIRGSSFRFVCMKDRWSETAEGIPLRVIEEARLVEVGPVARPAYLGATAGLNGEARSLALKGLSKALEMPVQELAQAGEEELRSLCARANGTSIVEKTKSLQPEWLRKAKAENHLRHRGFI